MDPKAILELKRVLEAVPPGQRIHGATILKRGVSDPSVRSILMDPSALAAMTRRECSLREFVCSGTIDTPPGVRILRRRFTPEERLHVLADLNNLYWTLPPGVVSNLLQDLRSFGIQWIEGIADATLPALVGGHGLEDLAPLCDHIQIVPAGTPADQVILERANRERTMVLSNDTFRDWRSRFPALRRSLWRIRFSVASAPDHPRGYSLGDAGLELSCQPCVET